MRQSFATSCHSPTHSIPLHDVQGVGILQTKSAHTSMATILPNLAAFLHQSHDCLRTLLSCFLILHLHIFKSIPVLCRHFLQPARDLGILFIRHLQSFLSLLGCLLLDRVPAFWTSWNKCHFLCHSAKKKSIFICLNFLQGTIDYRIGPKRCHNHLY